MAEGIRQNLDNQRQEFIQPFFATLQLVLAGNDSEGLRYGTIETPERYYLTWKEDDNPGAVALPAGATLLDRQLAQLCGPARLLEMLHDFVVFDSGTKKLCRPNQYFGVRAAQEFIRRREGGIIWHTQGSGKSLTMVWLARWIREHRPDARVLIVTDRTELDEQIEKVFLGVDEAIYRAPSGADLIAALNSTIPWLLCALVHKFGRRDDERDTSTVSAFIEEIRKALPPEFRPKGDLYVFVDECHRTQTGLLHRAMKAIVPNAVFIGFTGTPLLKEDKQRSIEVFGRYIHTYKFKQAVQDRVVLDLRYEARDIDQYVKAPQKIDGWFEAKTRGLTDVAKATLKQRWGTMQKVLSSRDRLKMIVDDIVFDMSTRPRLLDGRGNAMLVSGDIYQACKLYDLFSDTDLAGKCAIVTSYKPGPHEIKGESTGEGETERLEQYNTYRAMLADWFHEEPDKALNRVEEFEEQVKDRFIKEPGQMKLLIVVDKLLTGFDAPPATYLYIDKQMRDHGLFQAICRVNRLDGDDKEYGYIIDYKDLFKSLAGAVRDYTSGALDGYDREDVAGLLEDRLRTAREHLEEVRERVRALCEPVALPHESVDYLRYFCAEGSGNEEHLKANEPKRLELYKLTASLIRAYAALANDLIEAGYSPADGVALRAEVDHYSKVRDEVRLASGDYIDLKMYEPAMRHLIDTYLRAEESAKLSAFDDLSLVQLIVERGSAAVEALPEAIKANPEAVAETIENNVRRLIIDESPINPQYYATMSALLTALIERRRSGAIAYQEYLAEMAALTAQAASPGSGSHYPHSLATAAQRALYDNLEHNEALALAIDNAVLESRQDGWRSNILKLRKVRGAIKQVLEGAQSAAAPTQEGRVKEAAVPYQSDPPAGSEATADRLLELAKNQYDY